MPRGRLRKYRAKDPSTILPGIYTARFDSCEIDDSGRIQVKYTILDTDGTPLLKTSGKV